ncbi:hypothetical protein GCM10023194_02280 [Planotetraspora phitsanulokensis]|uniref:Uncharacterized protein n=1 Tax=Planotetraspora phitsanulokensis TaxID=575192 RepID=A0A8J3U9F9_9ACTN|nr:hypothetical protein [Planotetraspora phitsanulokensis]GII40496.1 hypothetical protein Pph01_54990 [Planotetraspora phitsanulokensis]
MSGFTFELVRRTPTRPAEMRVAHLVLTGTAGPYGEVTVTVGTVPRVAALDAPGLPEASVSHPDAQRQGLIAVDEHTRLSVGGVSAVVSQNRRSLGKKGRGIGIRLEDRDYTYVSAAVAEEELRDRERGPLVRLNSPFASSKVTVAVLPAADASDLALALVLQGVDRTGLTLTQSAVSGVLSFLNNGKADV